MRAAWFVVALLAAVVGPRAAAQSNSTRSELLLGPYQQADGAITVFMDGQFVEPYFTVRALLAGAQLGLDFQPAARRWITWQMQHLDRTSGFAKYCRAPGAIWATCGAADADDAALALWIELLYRTAGRAGLPAEWRRSADDASVALRGLYDARTGLYVVSRALPVSLFMDNIEIASAFDAVGRAQDAAGGHRAAVVSHNRAAALRRAINRVFWDATTRTYRITTQQVPPTPPAFYPDHVAQIFPALFGYGSPSEKSNRLYSRWVAQYGSQWLAGTDHEYPWGLVAVAALQYGDRPTVNCWLGAALSRRYGVRWNVLEEAIFQGLMPSFATGGAVPPCAMPHAGRDQSAPVSR
jgi:hypothetical protein